MQENYVCLLMTTTICFQLLNTSFSRVSESGYCQRGIKICEERQLLQNVLLNIEKYPPQKTPLHQNHSGAAVTQWFRCCATNRNIAGSIPAGVIGIFH